MITNIPFQQLSISPKNVRQVTTTKAADQQLIASIRSQGVLQNLVVEPVGNDQFQVIAGGRRFAAVGHLIDGEELDSDFLIPCLVKSNTDEHIEISLAENTQREAMHPADRFLAYKALADQGYSEEDIAARFGVAIQSVRKLLALSKVSPKLLDYFRKGKLSLECLMAFTVHPDHKKQLACYKDLSQRHIYPNAVRSWLLDESVSTASSIGAFVGKAAYLKAGGAVSTDLFENHTYLNDHAMVHQLAEQKLTRQANKLKKQEAWSWVDISLLGTSAASEFVQLKPQLTDVPQSLSNQIKQLTKQAEQLEEQCIAEGWPETLEQKFEIVEKALDEAIEVRDQDYLRFSDEQMSYAGCIVTFDYHGKLTIIRGLALKKDVQRHQRQAQAVDTTTETTDKTAATYSQALLNDLAAHRQQITKACLLKHPNVALDILHYSLCVQVLSGRYHRCHQLIDAHFNEVVSESSRDDLNGTPADAALNNFQKKNCLSLGWMKPMKENA